MSGQRFVCPVCERDITEEPGRRPVLSLSLLFALPVLVGMLAIDFIWQLGRIYWGRTN
jgi:hypothetical protein